MAVEAHMGWTPLGSTLETKIGDARCTQHLKVKEKKYSWPFFKIFCAPSSIFHAATVILLLQHARSSSSSARPALLLHAPAPFFSSPLCAHGGVFFLFSFFLFEFYNLTDSHD